MAVAVHAELCAGRPLVPHFPEAGDAVTGVERIYCINEEESPFLLVLLLDKEVSVRVHRALYPRLEASAQLRIAAYILGLGAGNLQDALGQEPAPDLVNLNRPNALALIQCYQQIGQEGAGRGPGQEVIRYLVGDQRNHVAQTLAGNAKAQQPLLQAGGVDPTRTGSADQLPGDLINGIFRDVERYELQDNVVVLEHFDVGDDQRWVLFLKYIDDQSSRLCVVVFRREDAPPLFKGS